MTDLFIGAMSGTSLDGVDAVLMDFAADREHCPGGRLLAHAHEPFDADLARELRSLNRPGDNEIHRSALATHRLAEAYAAAVREVLRCAGVPPSTVCAIGAHGQTVRHQPGLGRGPGYTHQLDPGAILTVLCGIDVVSDFRSQDVALGGQGAPLVPAYHDAVFRCVDRSVAVLNLGGMGNLTGLVRGQPTCGFDTGPGNVLLDHWCHRHTGRAFDANGEWAGRGAVVEGLVDHWLTDPFFRLPPPKSTGRELFDAPWLEAGLGRWRETAGSMAAPSPEDVQASLAELTARSVAVGLRWLDGEAVQRLWVCGGGALNGDLLARLARRLPGVSVHSTASAGIDPTAVEACAFAWLARARVHGEAGTLTAVTGAAKPAVSGAWRHRVA